METINIVMEVSFDGNKKDSIVVPSDATRSLIEKHALKACRTTSHNKTINIVPGKSVSITTVR